MTQERWQRISYWPLNVASFVFLIAYSWRVIADVRGPNASVLNIVLVLVWALFALHFFVSLGIARPRGAWFRKNWWQLIFVVVPALQPVRLLRLVPVLAGSHRKGASGLRTRIATYVGLTLILVLYIGAVMVLDVEQNAPGATIRSFGDASWWAIVTVTTVGYGDFVPVTVQGRLVATALMISGIAVIGTVTGTLASYLSERARADDPTRQAATRAEIEDLQEQVATLTQSLDRSRAASEGPQDPPAEATIR